MINLTLVIIILSIGVLTKVALYGFAEGLDLCVRAQTNVPPIRLAKLFLKNAGRKKVRS